MLCWRALLFCLVFMGLAGCALLKAPTSQLDAARKNEASAERALLVAGQEYTAAAGAAATLDPAPTRHGQAAEMLLAKANRAFDLALGPILPAKQAWLDELVANLVSENEAMRAKAGAALAGLDGAANKAAHTLAEERKRVAVLSALVAEYAAERDAVARKWERLVRWAWLIGGGWVCVAFVLPLIGRAFPAVGSVAGIGQALVAPFAMAALAKTKRVLGDVVGGVHELRTQLKETGTISKTEADATLSQWVTEADGTAAVVDAVRREKGLV